MHACVHDWVFFLNLQIGEEFREEESRHLGQPPFNFSRSSFARYCHDATWALAWSLNKSVIGVL